MYSTSVKTMPNGNIDKNQIKNYSTTHLSWVFAFADIGDLAGKPGALGLPLSTYSETEYHIRNKVNFKTGSN